MTEILLSVRKQWSRRILKRQKTIELRKNRPQTSEDGHYRIYLYETAACGGAGAVVGECICYHIAGPLTQSSEIMTLVEGSMVPLDQIVAYGRGRQIYGWFINTVTEYSHTRSLSDFGLKRAPQSWCYVKEEKQVSASEQKCRVCGCTNDHACPGGCYWVEPDLCSKCAFVEGGD